MARLIDVDALETRMGSMCDEFDTDHLFIDAIVYEIGNAPTVDAVPVVHGHWCWQGKFRACSKCGSYVEFTETLGASFWKFCPYCGAKMDLEVE